MTNFDSSILYHHLLACLIVKLSRTRYLSIAMWFYELWGWCQLCEPVYKVVWKYPTRNRYQVLIEKYHILIKVDINIYLIQKVSILIRLTRCTQYYCKCAYIYYYYCKFWLLKFLSSLFFLDCFGTLRVYIVISQCKFLILRYHYLILYNYNILQKISQIQLDYRKTWYWYQSVYLNELKSL